MAARPDRRKQHDDGTSLARLETRMAAVVGSTVGGLIAEEDAIDDPFCRLLAAATDECAGPAEQADARSGSTSYRFRINDAFYRTNHWRSHYDEHHVTVSVALWDDGDVAVAWRHPAPYLDTGFRTVHALTCDGFRFVNYADAYPMIADAARKLVTGLRDAWADYRDAQTAAYLEAA